MPHSKLLYSINTHASHSRAYLPQAPDSLKCTSVAIGSSLSHSLGSVISLAAMQAFGTWIGETDLDDGQFANFMW